MDKQVLAVQMENVSKYFGGICAVNNVSLEIRKGTIHALMGENGAGKSTLMKMLCGIISTDKGTIKLDGKQVKLHSLIDAQEHKLAIVPQELALVEYFTVAENMFLGREQTKGGFISKQKMFADAATELKKLKIDLDPKMLVGDLSVSQQQMLVIAKVLSLDAETIILDEPTVGLDPKQIIEIRELIRELAKEHTVILSSHILAEIQEVCDYIMIISKGKLVASDTPENLEKLLTNQQTVEILAKGNEDTVRKVIGTIGNVQKASVEHGKEEGTVKASLFPKDGKDIRETVFMAFAQEGCPLLMLYHSRTTLEDVFLELTQGSTPAAAKAMKDGEKKGRMVKRRKKNAQEEAEENELTEMDEEPEENAVPTSEDEKEDLENDSNL